MSDFKSLPYPLNFICPACRAAISAKCTKRNNWGQSFIEEFDKERIDLAAGSGVAFDPLKLYGLTVAESASKEP